MQQEETTPGTPKSVGKIRRRPFRWLLILLAFVLLVPYGASRILSTYRSVETYHLDTADAVPPAESDVLRVCCFNIAHGRGLAAGNMSGGDREQRNERLRSIGELLRDINADVVVLNEVDFNSTWSYGVNQARELAIEAGYAFVAEQRNLDFQIVFGSWQFGNVVLSRYPISNASLVNYPSLRTWEAVLAGKKRGMLCQIDFNGQPVTVAAIHLSHRSEDLRLASAEMILARVHGVAHPIILAGDFNSSPSDFPHSQQTSSNDNTIDMLDRANCLRRRPTEGPADSEYTFRSNVPDRTIDWIMISNDCQFNSYRAVDSQLSDHRPVVADVLLP